MAIRTYSNSTPRLGVNNVFVMTYEPLLAGDTGAPLAAADFADKTIQMYGTFGGTVVMQGSNDPRVITDPPNAVWNTMKSVDGTDISLMVAGAAVIRDNFYFIRPMAGVGVGGVVVSICGKRAR